MATDSCSPQRIHISMMEKPLLIWLDSNIDENNTDCRNAIIRLQRCVNTISTFTDSDKCIEYIESINNEKACMIVSGSLGQHIIPRIHDLSQIDSIFIFCSDQKRHEHWTKNWSKIKGIFTEIVPICETLKNATYEWEHNAISMSFMDTSDNVCRKNLDRLNCSFMYTQVLKEILLTIGFEKKHINEFIDYCRQHFAGNENELQNIEKFERNYNYQTPIWWYTYECFLYPMLNHALRTMDVDVIIKMGFFIVDLHRHIEFLHNEQFSNHHFDEIFTTYRGQGLSRTDFDQLMNTKGGLMAINNFLSTSKDRNVSLNFARKTLTNSDMIGILFVITVDPSQSTTPFASIIDVGCYKDKEAEILFSMHTVFRVENITSIDTNNRLYQVNLTLTSDMDKDLQMLTRSMLKDAEEGTGWFRLGLLLRKMGQFEKAEKVYQVLLEQTNDNAKGAIYDRLGKAKQDLGEYEEAIILYKEAIDIHQKNLPSHPLNLAGSYNNIAVVYEKLDQCSNALFYHEKSLEIKELNLAPNHPSLGASYTNIGVVHRKMGDPLKALSYYEKSLEIKQQTLPSNHPDLAKCYINHGIVYANINENEKAVAYFEKALAIQEQTLPSNHPDFSMSYNNIAIAYRKLGEYSKAFSYCEKDMEIKRSSLPPNHPRFTMSYNNIALVYKDTGDYSKALSYYEKVLEIQQQSLSPNQSDLAKSYSNIGKMYDCMKDYSKALLYYEKALEIQQQTLPSDHPNLGMSYNKIGLVYKNMGDVSKAYSSFERAVDIGEQSLPADHPNLQIYKGNLQRIQKNL